MFSPTAMSTFIIIDHRPVFTKFNNLSNGLYSLQFIFKYSKYLLYQQPPSMKYNKGHFDNVGCTTLHYTTLHYTTLHICLYEM